jgi:hypothetical protein
MPDRLKRLKRLRETWATRKRSTEMRMAACNVRLLAHGRDEDYVLTCLSGGAGTASLFPDLAMRRLQTLGRMRGEMERELASLQAAHRHDMMNLRRIEILEDRHRRALQQKEDAALLDVAIEGALLRKFAASET